MGKRLRLLPVSSAQRDSYLPPVYVIVQITPDLPTV